MKKVCVGFITLILALTTITFFPLKTKAATLDVCPACTYTTIAAAVAAAGNDNTINVAAGTYNENVVITSINNLTLRGAGSQSTILEGDGSPGSVGLDVVTSSNFKLEGFGITNYEDGLYLDGGSAEIFNNRFYNNTTEINAAAVIIISTATDFHNNKIENNTGAFFGIAAEMETGGESNIHHNQFSQNIAAILAIGEVNIYQNQINNNSLAGILGFSLTGSIYNNTVSSNLGGFYDEFGGGIFLLDSSAEVFSNRIEQNNGFFGTGIALIFSVIPGAQNGGGGSKVYNNYIANNTGIGGGAGILMIEDSSPIYNNTIVNNSATGGTIPPTPSSSPEMVNSSIKNHLPSFSSKTLVATKMNQIRTNNEPKVLEAQNKVHMALGDGDGDLGGGILIANQDVPGPNIFNNIIWGNTDDIYDVYGNASITYSDIEEGYGGTGNIHNNPKLSGLYLNQDSPAIDAGTSNGAPTTDILGGVRPQNGGIDMGAYEYGPLLPQSGALKDTANSSSSSPKPNYLLIIILTAPLPVLYFFLKRFLTIKKQGR